VLHVAAGVVRPLVLELRSPAPAPPVRAASSAGAVVASGHEGNGSYTGVRIAPRGPSRLVLGESYSRGWRASCGGRSLGPPALVDGFANGWRVGPGCREVSFRFAPQDAVDAGHWIGAAACALLVLLLVARRPRSKSRGTVPLSRVDSDLPVDDRLAPWPAGPAALAGLVAGVALGFVFAIRAGVVIAPAVALILWRGWSQRTLIAIAGGLLCIVVPVLYLLFPGTDRGGYDTDYATEHLGAHWVAVAAIVLLVVALARALSTATRASRGRASGRAAAPAGRGRP
jgi:hypothetical protein